MIKFIMWMVLLTAITVYFAGQFLDATVYSRTIQIESR